MLALKEEQENAKKSILWRCHDYALALGKLLDIGPSTPKIAGRQIHHANASASTPFDYYLQNMCLPFPEHLIEELNTGFDRYGSMIYKIHAFVP